MRFFSFPYVFLSFLYYSFYSTSNEELSWGVQYINVVNGWFTSLYVHLSISFRIVLFCGYFFILTHLQTYTDCERKEKPHWTWRKPKKKKNKRKTLKVQKLVFHHVTMLLLSERCRGRMQGIEHLITLFHRSNFQAANYSPTWKTFSRFVYESSTNEWIWWKKTLKVQWLDKSFRSFSFSGLKLNNWNFVGRQELMEELHIDWMFSMCSAVSV